MTFLASGRSGRPFDAGVNVLGVLAEDDHVHFFGALHGRRNPGEIHDRPQTNIKVEHLTQRHIEGTDAPSHRRGQRTLDAHQIFFEGFHRIVREPILELVESGLPGIDLEPGDLLLPAVGLLDRRVEDAHRGAPDVRTRAVAFDERKDRIVRNFQHAVLDGDLFALGRFDVLIAIGHG